MLAGTLVAVLLLLVTAAAAAARAGALAREAGRLRQAVALRAAVLGVADSLQAAGSCTDGRGDGPGPAPVAVTWRARPVAAGCRWTVTGAPAGGGDGVERVVRRREPVAATREHS